MCKIPIVAVVGPTASGKTALAIEIAKHFNGEIVSADSMQIYKGICIGTAKPSPEEMCGIPHHLMDFLELSEAFSVAQYVKLAHEVIADIHSRGKLPVVVGGTGLYVSSLLNDITFDDTENNLDYRKELYDFARENGEKALHNMLKEIDPNSAALIHENNIPRVVRAIEVFKLTGKTMTQLQLESKQNPCRYSALKIGVSYENRALLYERINNRVDLMLEQGLLDEARLLMNSNISATVSQAIGYKELFPYLKGCLSLEDAVSKLKQETRHYAKRQLTWFKRDSNIEWFMQDAYGNYGIMQKKVLNLIEKFLFL